MAAPLVTGINTSLTFNQVVAAGSLFGVTDPEGDPITQYEFWDSAGGGVFRISGVAQAAGVAIPVSAAQLASVDYRGSADPSQETVWVRAFDGSAWSAWAAWTMRTQATANAQPVVSAPDRNSDLNQWRTLSELVAVSDADLDVPSRYEIRDLTAAADSGYLWGNGAAVAQGATILVGDLASTWIRGGSVAGANDYEMRAFDGFAWGAWEPFTITTRTQSNRAPVVSAPNGSVQAGASVVVGSPLSVSDTDADAPLRYGLWDSVGGGYFQTDATVQPAGVEIVLTPAQLADTVYVGGAMAGSETLWVRVDDGQAWSLWEAWDQFTQTRPTNALPVIDAPDRNSDLDQWRTLSELVSVSDADGDWLNQFEIRDLTATAGSGYLWGNGADVAQGGSILVSDLASTWIRGGAVAGANGYEMRAFDTFGWSAWEPFTITTRTQANRAPVLSAPDASVIQNQTVAVSSLVTVTDADADAMQLYKLWDSPGGGYFQTGATVQPSGQAIVLTPAQWAQTNYVGGAIKGAEMLWAAAYDGQAWSLPTWDDWTMSTLRAGNIAPVVVAPDRAAVISQWLLLSDFVAVSDADLDPILGYEIRDLNAAAGSAVIWANAASQPQGSTVAFASLGSAWVGGAGALSTDGFEIRARDSEGAWSAWEPFSVRSHHTPTVVARDGGVSVDASNHEVPASFFFTAADPDGDAIANYGLWDSPGGGYFRTGATVHPSGGEIVLTPAEMANTVYVGANTDAAETVWVRVSDGSLQSGWAGWDMYTVATPQRYPEIIGTAGNDSYYATSTATAYFGRGGDDLFENAAPMFVDENIFVGGIGADTYRLWGGNTSTLVADIGNSAGDVADVKFFGFTHPAAVAAIIDGRHLLLGEVTPFALNAVFFIDWQLPENRIETWQLFMGATYTYDQFNQALAGISAPHLSWEDVELLPWEIAQINEAITYYAQRELAAQAAVAAASAGAGFATLAPLSSGGLDLAITAAPA